MSNAGEETRILLGARRSRASGPADPGHAWLVLCDKSACCGMANCAQFAEKQPDRAFVGYYPNMADVPEFEEKPDTDPLEVFYLYFWNNSVPGIRRIDEHARQTVSRVSSALFKWQGFSSTVGTLDGPRERVAIPAGRASVTDGRYGLNTSKPGVNNCVSWAVGALNAALPPAHQLPLSPEPPPKVKDLMAGMPGTICIAV